jgi:hypothetical protein
MRTLRSCLFLSSVACDHTNDTGGPPQSVSISPSTWTESGRTPILREVSK